MNELLDRNNIIDKLLFDSDYASIKKTYENNAWLFFHEYDLINRISASHIEIFVDYFAAYRTTRISHNAMILASTKDPDFEIALKTPILSEAVKSIARLANTIRQVSVDLKIQAQELAEKNYEEIREDYEIRKKSKDMSYADYLDTIITPNKIKIAANMVNSILESERSEEEIDKLIQDYLDRELPIRES